MMLLLMGRFTPKLQDTAKCWVPELNAEFAGKLDYCNAGRVTAYHEADCETTAANINKNYKYKGPPMTRYNVVRRHNLLGWASAANCTKGIKDDRR